jgi:predicted DCC family thiol-disulfide oxidoreductase YuxK
LNSVVTEHKHLILFDGVCNFCNGSVNFIIRHDKKDHFRFVPLQSPPGQQLLRQFGMEHLPMDSIVLIENKKVYKRSTAVLRISKKLNGLYPLLYGFIILPTFIRDTVYNLVARNRYKWFGKKDSCMVPTPEIQRKFIS